MNQIIYPIFAKIGKQCSAHGLRTPREEIAFTARPKIQSQSQIFRCGRSIFCLPHRPNVSDFFDLCLHWVSVVRGLRIRLRLSFSTSFRILYVIGTFIILFCLSWLYSLYSWKDDNLLSILLIVWKLSISPVAKSESWKSSKSCCDILCTACFVDRKLHFARGPKNSFVFIRKHFELSWISSIVGLFKKNNVWGSSRVHVLVCGMRIFSGVRFGFLLC